MKKVRLIQKVIEKIKSYRNRDPEELTPEETNALKGGDVSQISCLFYVNPLRGILLDPKEGEVEYNEKRKEPIQEICNCLLKHGLLEEIPVSENEQTLFNIVDEKLHTLSIQSELGEFRAALIEIKDTSDNCHIKRFFEGKKSQPCVHIEGETIRAQCFNFYSVIQKMNHGIKKNKKIGEHEKKPIADAFLITRSENTKVCFMTRMDKPFVLILETPKIILAGMILVQMKNTLRDILKQIK